ncbi:MAG: nuclear transport factor 2 family protein [Solirubrobacterales bacterium]
MSQENVEIVRRVFDAEVRGDTETALALYDPEIEFDNSRSPVADFAGTVGRVFRGRDGVQAAFRDWYEAWKNVESELEEMIDAGGEHVVSVITYRARGRTSGVEVEFPHMAGIWTIRNGMVARVAWLPSREDALEAAGLSE